MSRRCHERAGCRLRAVDLERRVIHVTDACTHNHVFRATWARLQLMNCFVSSVPLCSSAGIPDTAHSWCQHTAPAQRTEQAHTTATHFDALLCASVWCPECVCLRQVHGHIPATVLDKGSKTANRVHHNQSASCPWQGPFWEEPCEQGTTPTEATVSKHGTRFVVRCYDP